MTRHGRIGQPFPFCAHADGVEACWNERKSGYFCGAHDQRLRKSGNLGSVAIAPRRPGGKATVSKHNQGYAAIYEPNHPLAAKNGSVLQHRSILWTEIGPGDHSCHWCSRVVSWDLRWPKDGHGALVVDHLDHDRRNNAPDNLVASCSPCNAGRTK